MVRLRSCRVIYYFDTPTLGRRHQSFGCVTKFTISSHMGCNSVMAMEPDILTGGTCVFSQIY